MPQPRAELLKAIRDLMDAPVKTIEDPTVAALVLSQMDHVSMTSCSRGFVFRLEAESGLLDRLLDPGLTDLSLQSLVRSLETDLGFAREKIRTVESAVLAAAREWRVDPRAPGVPGDGGRR